MSSSPSILAIGLVDARGVAGTSGVNADWKDLGVEPPGTAPAFRAVFHAPDPTFRRLDRASRALVMAAEAADLARVLPAVARDDTAIVVETERGCLDADRRFARGLAHGVVEGAVFPYTLASASLGEVALRLRLRGPALCLSIGPEQGGEALREAGRLLEDGDARFVLACCVEALSEPCSGAASALRAVVVLLAGRDEAAETIAPWPAGSADPFALLAASVRRVAMTARNP